MLLIEKKVIEEISYLPWNNPQEHEPCIDVKDLLSHSKEVEVVEIDEMWITSAQDNYHDFIHELVNNGYQLIKIKQ